VTVGRRARRVVGRTVRRRARPLQLRTIPETLLELSRFGPAPLTGEPIPPERPIAVATIIPSFRRGSGGHATIVNLMRELGRLEHAVSLWLEDYEGRHAGETPREAAEHFAEFFGASDLELHVGFDDWSGADIVLATAWQTVPRALLLPRARARAYLVQDHEPDFYAPSAEAMFAEATYRQGVHCIAASPWLAELLRRRYGAIASHFDLAVDHATYRPEASSRRDDLVVFYARAVTPRRAVPLGVLAFEELARRRPDIEIALFGEDSLDTSFPHTNLGIRQPAELARLYSRATVGMAFSLTNPSLISLEMMASGLACVELATDSMLATFGADGPLKLTEPDPLTLCAAVEELLADADERERLSRAGIGLMANRTWARAGRQVEASLRAVTGAIVSDRERI
jgi:glycosyltransferase involved in cell wall biosynthesis